jgi:hypothetical protein
MPKDMNPAVASVWKAFDIKAEEKKKKASEVIGKSESKSASQRLSANDQIGDPKEVADFSRGASRGPLSMDEYGANLRKAWGFDKKKK